MPIPALITFIAYLIILLGIGFCFYRRSASIEDYLLGGRGMGSWVTALSAQASDMSGWLLMGLPGAIYLGGMVTGTVVLVLWKQIGLSDTMYEIVPGFAANCLMILMVDLIIGQKEERVLQEFDEVIKTVRFT